MEERRNKFAFEPSTASTLLKNSTYTETFVQLRDKILSYGRDKKKIEVEGERIISGHFSNLQQGFSYVPFSFRGMNHILFPNLFSSFKVFLAHVRMAPSSRNFAKIREESHDFVPFFFSKKKKLYKYKKADNPYVDEDR